MPVLNRRHSNETWRMGGLTPADVPRVMMAVEERAIAEEQTRGHMQTFEVVTDGSPNKPPSMVRPGGYISAIDKAAGRFRKAIGDLWEILIRLSPYSPKSEADIARGFVEHYIDQHLMIVNGTHMMPSQIPNYDPEDDDQVIFLNSQPYARRLERGWSWQAPTGIYRVAVREIRARYGDELEISYTDRFAESQFGLSGRGQALRYPSILMTGRRGKIGIFRGHFISRSSRAYRDLFV